MSWDYDWMLSKSFWVWTVFLVCVAVVAVIVTEHYGKPAGYNECMAFYIDEVYSRWHAEVHTWCRSGDAWWPGR